MWTISRRDSLGKFVEEVPIAPPSDVLFKVIHLCFRLFAFSGATQVHVVSFVSRWSAPRTLRFVSMVGRLTGVKGPPRSLFRAMKLLTGGMGVHCCVVGRRRDRGQVPERLASGPSAGVGRFIPRLRNDSRGGILAGTPHGSRTSPSRTRGHPVRVIEHLRRAVHLYREPWGAWPHLLARAGSEQKGKVVRDRTFPKAFAARARRNASIARPARKPGFFSPVLKRGGRETDTPRFREIPRRARPGWRDNVALARLYSALFVFQATGP